MTAKQKNIQQNGFVLVVVLCMVILLAVMLFGFNIESRLNLRAVDGSKRSEQALNCARAGLNIAIAAIRTATDTQTDKMLQDLLSGENTFDVANGTCSINVVEESSKLNVNLLKNKNGRLNRTRIDQLLRLIDRLNENRSHHCYIGYTLVPSIIDWTDNDDQVTYLPFIKNENLGAESIYYGQLKNPYYCKDGSLDTTEELLLVKGVTMQVYNRIRDYVTVYGDGRININYASQTVIESLSEKMDPALAQMIINQRRFKPFENISELRNVPGMTNEIYNSVIKTADVTMTDRYYYVTSSGNVDRFGCTIIAVLRKNGKTKNIEIVLYKEC